MKNLFYNSKVEDFFRYLGNPLPTLAELTLYSSLGLFIMGVNELGTYNRLRGIDNRYKDTIEKLDCIDTCSPADSTHVYEMLSARADSLLSESSRLERTLLFFKSGHTKVL